MIGAPKNLEFLIPDKANLPDPNAEAVNQALQGAHSQAVDGIKKTLHFYATVPGESALAVVEDFIDQILYSNNVEDQWRSFYRTYRSKVWVKKFEQGVRVEEARQRWPTLVNSAIQVNQATSLRFRHLIRGNAKRLCAKWQETAFQACSEAISHSL